MWEGGVIITLFHLFRCVSTQINKYKHPKSPLLSSQVVNQ